MGSNSVGTMADPSVRQRVLDLIRAGHGIGEAAAGAGVSASAIRNWRKKDPDFDLDFEAAVDESVEPVIWILREQALQGDTTAAKEFLKHMAPLSRAAKQEIEVKTEATAAAGAAELVAGAAALDRIAQLQERARRAAGELVEDTSIVDAEIVEDDDDA